MACLFCLFVCLFGLFGLFGLFVCLACLAILFKIVEKHVVLLCFRSHVLKNHWFYYVLAQKALKSIGFTVFSLEHVEKALVLLCFRSQVLKKHVFCCVLGVLGSIFLIKRVKNHVVDLKSEKKHVFFPKTISLV